MLYIFRRGTLLSKCINIVLILREIQNTNLSIDIGKNLQEEFDTFI